MDFATTDLAFAIGHHVLIFALAGVIAFEVGVVKPGLTASDIARVGKADAWYGILAVLILIVGFARANFAAKGWDYYSHNHFFWAKIWTFALVGVLSVPPTIQYIRWRRALKNDPAGDDLRKIGEIGQRHGGCPRQTPPPKRSRKSTKMA